MANIEVLNEVSANNPNADGCDLYFQHVIYHYDNGTQEDGYRFIYRNNEGNLLPHKGQARISNKKELLNLINLAVDAGWLK